MEVLATPGPNEGHISLYDAEEDALFSGDLVTDGLPERVTNVQDYVSALERAAKADPEILYPNRGLVDEWGSFSLKRSGRFLNNFLTNAAQALGEGPTLMEFAAADLGFVPSDPIRFAATLLVYRAFLDEMVRARVIDARGTGWEREYGVDVEEENDPEAPGRAMRVSEDDPPPMP